MPPGSDFWISKAATDVVIQGFSAMLIHHAQVR